MSRFADRSRAWLRDADSRVPPAVPVALGVVCTVLGAFVVLRPFASLALLVAVVVVGAVVLGVAELVGESGPSRPGDVPAARRRRFRGARGVAFLALALAVLLWPGPSLVVVTVLVGLGLVVAGALDVGEGLLERGADRWAPVMLGAASVVLGLLALAWPDVTVLVVAVVFGARLVLLGVRLVVGGLRRRSAAADGFTASERPRTARRGRGAVVGAAGALVLVAALAVVSAGIQRGVPHPDAFYDPPASVPDEPGRLLRAEPFTRAVPDGATAWRILYTTTRDDDEPALASGIVVVPDLPDDAAPPPVIAWAHGTTGYASGCAPSVLDEPFESGAFFVLDGVLARGWALVATDYTGLGTAGPHPYLVGQGEGRSVLDAVRAARDLDDLALDDRTVVWGHSQGGHAALWTGQLAPDYAPDVPLAGVAALAPASDLPGLVGALEGVEGGSIFASYVLAAYDAAYPDADPYQLVRPGGRLVVREMATRCLAEPGALVSVAEALAMDQPLWTGDPTAGAFGDRLAENVPTGAVPAPLLIAQGSADPLVLPSAQDAYVGTRCSAGQPVDYRRYDGRDHVGLVEADSPLVPELLRWTEDRFAGVAPTPTCVT
ncbi:lipase family protein [Cellulosimicrobium cellulans]|uniref:lipase family protein n=1 Tax=Cellulosimicrobium cellulans TaxID=1710 RepID=UPI0009F1795A|nr:lipase family protein [Cellulosimicrobium cellulans]